MIQSYTLLPTGAVVAVESPPHPIVDIETYGPPSLDQYRTVGGGFAVVPVAGPQGLTGATQTTVTSEGLAGTKNGSNMVFTTAFAYLPGTTAVYRNGLRETRTVGYNETNSTTVTFTTAPLSTDDIRIDYVRS